VNTPTHAALNVLVLGRGRTAPRAWIATAAVLPDVPMFAFFLYESFVRGEPVRRIFGETYFEPRWQTLFDASHSIPVFAVLGLWFLWRRNRTGQFFAASLILHSLVDWPTHLEDAHAYFWPIWREPLRGFISYWHSDSRFWLLELSICAAAVIWILAERGAAVIASRHARRLVSTGGADRRRRGGLRASGTS
jgi:hypothetical protein